MCSIDGMYSENDSLDSSFMTLNPARNNRILLVLVLVSVY
jgi:hypothetical protein